MGIFSGSASFGISLLVVAGGTTARLRYSGIAGDPGALLVPSPFKANLLVNLALPALPWPSVEDVALSLPLSPASNTALRSLDRLLLADLLFKYSPKIFALRDRTWRALACNSRDYDALRDLEGKLMSTFERIWKAIPEPYNLIIAEILAYFILPHAALRNDAFDGEMYESCNRAYCGFFYPSVLKLRKVCIRAVGMPVQYVENRVAQFMPAEDAFNAYNLLLFDGLPHELDRKIISYCWANVHNLRLVNRAMSKVVSIESMFADQHALLGAYLATRQYLDSYNIIPLMKAVIGSVLGQRQSSDAHKQLVKSALASLFLDSGLRLASPYVDLPAMYANMHASFYAEVFREIWLRSTSYNMNEGVRIVWQSGFPGFHQITYNQ